MIQGSAAPLFKQMKKFEKDAKEEKIDKLCKQVENLNLMMMKQPRQAPKQVETVCYKCGKKDYYASQCRMEQEPTCYLCAGNVIGPLSVARSSTYLLRARIATGMVTLLKTVSSKRAMKQSKNKM